MATIKTTYKPTLTAGQVYARKWGSTEPLAPIGNVLELSLTVDEETKTQQDMTKGGGGTHAQVKRVKSVKLSFKMADLNAINIARSIFGESKEVIGATVVDEQVTAQLGGLIRLAHPSPTAVKVTLASAQITPADNFEIRPEGIYILPDAQDINDADALEVSYTYGGYDAIQALTTSQPVIQLAFGGINEADGGKPVLVDVWRASLGAAKKLDLINNDFATLDVEGEVMVDPSKTGAGISRFYRVQLV